MGNPFSLRKKARACLAKAEHEGIIIHVFIPPLTLTLPLGRGNF